MNFARWTETPNLPGLEDAVEFIVDIPDGTSREDVVANIALDDYSDTITEADRFSFENEWPGEIQRQFAAGGGKRRPWKA